YQGKKLPEFRGLFTGDYRYEFSNSTDPTLVTKYASGWFAADESASAQHLFKGGNNSDGIYQQAASSIKIVFSPTAPGDDPDRDPATYKVLSTQVDGQIDVPNGAVTDTYVLNANRNRFYIVRGDSAVGLTTEQPADSSHWYIYKWVDETTP